MDGTFSWVKQISSESHITGYGISTLTDDTILLTGKFSGITTFGPGEPNETTINSYGSGDIFIAKFNSEGQFVEVRSA